MRETRWPAARRAGGNSHATEPSASSSRARRLGQTLISARARSGGRRRRARPSMRRALCAARRRRAHALSIGRTSALPVTPSLANARWLARRLDRASECRRWMDCGREPSVALEARQASKAGASDLGRPRRCECSPGPWPDLVFGLRALLAQTKRVSGCIRGAGLGPLDWLDSVSQSEVVAVWWQIAPPPRPEERRRRVSKDAPGGIALGRLPDRPSTRRLAPPAQDEVEGSQPRTPNGNAR